MFVIPGLAQEVITDWVREYVLPSEVDQWYARYLMFDWGTGYVQTFESAP